MSGETLITHKAADGISGTLNDSEEENSIDLTHSERDDDSSLESSSETRLKKSGSLVVFAIVSSLIQILIFFSIRNEQIQQQLPSIVQLQLQQLEQGLNDSWFRFNQTLPKSYITQERLRPGFQLGKEKGVKGKYPVVMVPGFVTSGLEVWQGKECAKKYFRQRMWGRATSVQYWLMERHCVIEHFGLDLMTGKDPEDIRIRAAQGFEAADYFMGNYWVWGKILENLADVGYDGSTMSMEPYDWRLAFPMLEERDGYLTKLKYKIEAFYKTTGEKVILTSHSLGGLLVHYFFAWVEEEDKNWVDKHIHAYVNIAGPLLGVPKAASALLSGEMSDTIFMGPVGTLVEQFISRKRRQELFSTWGSLWSMLPKGGDAVWGNIIQMTDKQEDTCENESKECTKSDASDNDMNEPMTSFNARNTHLASQIIAFLLKWGAGQGPNISPVKLHSFDSQEKNSMRTWHDVSRTPLPRAPNMKIYCLYGVGLETEKEYFYKRTDGSEGSGEKEGALSSQNVDLPFVVDPTVSDPESSIRFGVRYDEGDASVPLVSLGYMCTDAWRRQDSGLNPSKIEVITREYQHKEAFSVDDPMRRGPYSADHVDVLGNQNMLLDLIKIVTDHDIDQLQDEIVSNIKEIAKEINEKGGLEKQKRFRNPFRNWKKNRNRKRPKQQRGRKS